MFDFLLDFLFPKRCVHCRTFGSYLCARCLSKIEPVERAICPMCERSAIDGVAHPGCQTRLSLDGLVSFFRYDGTAKSAIKRLKYSPYLSELVNILLPSILATIEGKGGRFSGFTVVPVPLHPQRERERGFNQASLIGKAIADGLGLRFVDGVLQRTRNTKPQVELKGEDRRKNVINAFAIVPNSPAIRSQPSGSKTGGSQYPNILLVDDVWTTGSTLRTCSNILKRAGAKKVWAMTVAR